MSAGAVVRHCGDRLEAFRRLGERLRPSRAVEAEPGSSVDSGAPDLSAGISRISP
jgi:hypothetical protein